MNKANAANFGLSQIGQIAVQVKEIDRAVKFYRDTLGMQFLFQAPPSLAFFDCAGVRLLLDAAAENPSAVFSSIIYYQVSDIHEAHAILVGRGVTFETDPHFVAQLADHELWMAFFRDPDHNLLALMCEV